MHGDGVETQTEDDVDGIGEEDVAVTEQFKSNNFNDQ